jgi:hypothetical protein
MRWSFFLYLAFFIAISAVVNAAEGEIVDEYQMNEAINDAAQQVESTFAFDQYEQEEEFIPVRIFLRRLFSPNVMCPCKEKKVPNSVVVNPYRLRRRKCHPPGKRKKDMLRRLLWHQLRMMLTDSKRLLKLLKSLLLARPHFQRALCPLPNFSRCP